MAPLVETLVVDEHRIVPIARHDITVVVGARARTNTYGLVTARPARQEERRLYQELQQQQGGEGDDESCAPQRSGAGR